MWRYTDLRDFWRLFQASFVSSLILVGVILFLYRFEGYPRSVFVIDGMLTFLLCSGLRLGIRSLYRYRDDLKPRNVFSLKVSQNRSRQLQDVLIIGAGDAGEKLLRETIENPALNYHVAGFLDDNADKTGRAIHGVPVLGGVEELCYFVDSLQIAQIFIAIPSASGAQMRRITDLCRQCDVAFKTLPGLGEIMDGKVSVSDLREVSFEDLLGREPVPLDTGSIAHYVTDRNVLVTGAGGSIGSELCRQIVDYAPRSLILLDSSELNLYSIQMELEHEIGYTRFTACLGQVQDNKQMDRIFARYRPEVVFHAAAYKHVPILEANPWEAVWNNIVGSFNTMSLAKHYQSERFVLVSTDKAVRPTNVMGLSKRVAELFMHGLNNSGTTRFMAVRFGNVVGSSGSVIPLFKRQIAHGGPVSVTHPEITRYFMTIQEAAKLILQAGALGKGGEIFVLEMGTPMRIQDMARQLIKLMGKEPDNDIEIVYTGLRPGEKITEELITDEEGIHPTEHEGIMVLTHNHGNSNPSASMTWLKEKLEALQDAAVRFDSEAIEKTLEEIVPEHRQQKNKER
jgi:FlaA1/EpsC-like NDP-sugar epimerase